MAKGFLDGYKTYDTGKGYGNPDRWQEAFNQRMNREDAAVVLSAQQQSPYDILGIARSATAAEVKKAFRKLITQWHPDLNQHRITESEERSKKIIAAYSILTN